MSLPHDPLPEVESATPPAPRRRRDRRQDERTVIERLRPPMPDARRGWALVGIVSVVAFVLRIWNVGYPNKLVFDETYYAKDAWSVIQFGYERTWADNANDLIVNGNVDQMGTAAEFVVHPPLGKLLIGLGEAAFGMNSFGWRFSAVVCGTLLVAATMLLTRRLSRSNLVAALAGILLTVDGLAFTMSRLALLDIFQATFLVIAVACLVRDRDAMRARLAAHLEAAGLEDLGGAYGPRLWWRPWRLAAGVFFGCSIATKWNTIYALAAFAVLSLAWDIGARRLAGARRPVLPGLLRDGLPAFVQLVPVALLSYLASWIPWLASTGGWDRQWAAENPDTPLARALPRALASLVAFHREIYQFHTGSYINHATHPYASGPWGWLILARPLGLDAVNSIAPGTDGCPSDSAENCIRVMTTLGTPLLWWGAAAALAAAIVLWIGLRDQRFAVPVVGALSMWLPWYQYTERPLFFFYAICIIPFTVTALALCLGRIIGPADGGWRRAVGATVAGVFVALVILNFAWFWPIYTDGLLTWSQWWARMWFPSWV